MILSGCTAELDEAYSRCASQHPDYAVSAEDFSDAVAAAIEKYLIGFSKPDMLPKPREVQAFISELQVFDLYLALACARGNENAWWQFDRQYRLFIERLARHLLSIRADADEIIDHVYAELFGTKVVDGIRLSKFRTYSGRGTLQGWLRAVVSHAVIDFYRRRQDEISLDKLEEIDGRQSGARIMLDRQCEETMVAGIVRERYRAVTLAALDDALATLDDHEKLLLLYYHVEGLKLREIARIVEQSASPIRRWFQRRSKSGERPARVHESTVMRWLEKAYRKVSDRFHAELGEKHGLKPAEIEICMSLATRDLAESVTLERTKIINQGLEGITTVEGA